MSIADFCARWKRSNKTVIKYLMMLEDEGFVTRTTLHRQTPIVTLCKYDDYVGGLQTIVHTIVHTQNAYGVHTLNQGLNDCKSTSLGYEQNEGVHTQAQTIVHTQKKEKEKNPPTPPYKKEKEKILVGGGENAHTHESFGVESFKAFQALSVDEKIELLRRSPIWLEEICYKHRIDENTLNFKLGEFRSHCICEGTIHNNEADIKRHFNRWLGYNLTASTNGTNSSNRTNPDREQRDREFAEFIARNAPTGYN